MDTKKQARKKSLEAALAKEALTMAEALAIFAEIEAIDAEAENDLLEDISDARLCARFNCAL